MVWILTMGCASSVNQINKHSHDVSDVQSSFDNAKVNVAIEPVPRIHVTKEKMDLVRQSWNYVRDDFQGNGLCIFLRIFETCDEIKALFGVSDMPIDELKRNKTIKHHGSRFMSAIAAIIEATGELNDENGEISKLLFVLGQQHKGYDGFRAEYFEVFRNALLWQWERCMGPHLTLSVTDAWNSLFDYLMDRLLAGYHS